MAKEFFEGRGHYTTYGIESSYGTGTPVITNRISKLQNISYTFNNNLILSQGVGEGADATSANYGNFDVTGSLTVKPTEFHFLQFGSGTVTGTGATATPYKLIDADNIGYSGTFMRTAVLEVGAKGVSNNVAYRIPGVSFNSWTLSGNQGEELQCTVDFTGQTVKKSTSIGSYTSDGRKTITFGSGSVGWNNEELACTAFSVTCNYPSNFPREVFDRFVKQPTKGVRRYTWTLTLNKHFDDTANKISATELIDEFFGGSNTPDSSGSVTARDLYIHTTEGNATGDRDVKIFLENSSINDWAENPTLEGGVVSVTVNGVSLAAKTDSGDNVPVIWFSKT